MGTICVIGKGDKELERGCAIVGAGHMSGRLTTMVENISHHIPIVCPGSIDEAEELVIAATRAKGHPSILLVGCGQLPNQLPNREDFAHFIFKETALKLENLVMINKELLADEDSYEEEEEDIGCHEYFVYPSVISISLRWYNYLSGVPP